MSKRSKKRNACKKNNKTVMASTSLEVTPMYEEAYKYLMRYTLEFKHDGTTALPKLPITGRYYRVGCPKIAKLFPNSWNFSMLLAQVFLLQEKNRVFIHREILVVVTQMEHQEFWNYAKSVAMTLNSKEFLNQLKEKCRK